MGLVNFIKQHIFLILFFLVSILYGYGLVYNVISYIYLYKPFVIIFLILYYFSKSKKYNLLFLIGLGFAFVGDLFYNLNTFDTNLIAMSCFLVFNLVLTIIAAERAGVIKTTKLLLSMLPFIFIFVYVVYKFFSNAGDMMLLIGVYGFIVVLLCSFSLNTLVKRRDVSSLLFFLAALLFVVSSVCEGLEHFSNPHITFFIDLLNITSYILSLFFFSVALILTTLKSNSKKEFMNVRYVT